MSYKLVCVTCKSVNLPSCGHELKLVSHKWRAPKKNNIKAWKKVQAGNLLWDDKAIARKERLRLEKSIRADERRKENKRACQRGVHVFRLGTCLRCKVKSEN